MNSVAIIKEGQPIGFVHLVNGLAVPDQSVLELVNSVNAVDAGEEVSQDEGERYLVALVNSLRGTRVHAEPVA